MRKYIIIGLFLAVNIAFAAYNPTPSTFPKIAQVPDAVANMNFGVIAAKNAGGGAETANATDQFSGSRVQSMGATATALMAEDAPAANTFTIATNQLTWTGLTSANFPQTVGVGNVIVYDSGGAGTKDDYAIIKGISVDANGAKAYVTTIDGSTAPAAVTGENDYDVYRMYTTMVLWEGQGTANANLHATVEAACNLSTDITGGNGAVYVALYADAADSDDIDMDGWTTDATHWVELFTPNTTSMVLTSQRHSGTWDASKFIWELVEGERNIFRESYVRVIGLQIDVASTSTSTVTAGVLFAYMAAGTSDQRLGYSIIRCSTCTGTGAAIGIGQTNVNSELTIYNTIVYGFVSGADAGYKGLNLTQSNTTDIYNVTVNDCYIGIYAGASGVFTVKNTVVFETSNDFDGTIDSLTYSACDDADCDSGTGNVALNNIASGEWTAAFTSYGTGDFSVKDGSSLLYNAGMDASGDIAYITDDIIGTTRSTDDIGAFELP